MVVGQNGELEKAACLFEAMDAQRKRLHLHLQYPDFVENERHIRTIQEQMPDELFMKAWMEGQKIALSQVLRSHWTLTPSPGITFPKIMG